MHTISSMNRVPAELNLGGTSSSEKVFQTADSTPLAVVCPIPLGLVSNLTTTGRQTARVQVVAGGKVTGGTTTDYTPQLQFGVSTTAASNRDLESGANVAVNSVTGLWFLEGDLWITAGGIVTGLTRYGVYGSTKTYTDWTVVDNHVTTYDPTLLTAIQGFVVTGTFSSGNASNAAYLDYFVLKGVSI